MPLETLDGQMILPCGAEAVPARVSVRAGSGEASQISVTYGLHGSGSLRSAALTQSLASRLRRTTDLLGSTLFRLTWKERVTPSGRRICALRASGRRTSGSDCTSWPTPCNSEPDANSPIRPSRIATNRKTEYLGRTVALASWPTPNCPTGGPNTESTETHTGGMDLDGASRLASWATPSGEDAESAGMRHSRGTADTLSAQAGQDLASWATPTERDYRSESATQEFNEKRWNHPRGKPLSAEATLATWNTPTGEDVKTDGPKAMQKWEDHLQTGAELPTSVQRLWNQAQALLTASGEMPSGSGAETGSGGQLNPAHSRWLMGLPKEWDDCAATATPLLRQSRKRS